VYIFFWSKADDPPNKLTPENQVQKLRPEIRLIRWKIRYFHSGWHNRCSV